MLLDDARDGPDTQHSASSLKALRYEEAQEDFTPRRASPSNTTTTSSSSSSTPPLSRSELSFSRPRTSPSPRPFDVASLRSNETGIKRDSGIAPSVCTSDSHPSLPNTAAGAAREPTLPTIVVQNEASLASIDERSRSPFANRTGLRQRPRQAQSASPPRGVARMSSFKGIQTDIPTISADDINLDDLATDKVSFSTRGSLLFGGKKMQDLIAAKGEEGAQPNGTTTPAPIVGPRHETPHDETQSQTQAQTQSETQATAERPDHVQNDEKPKQGLVSGRRKPSVQMLQAALQGGRVLSAEEITFSLKVRSMYEHGDERAATWVAPLDEVLSERSTPVDRDTSVTPDMTNGDIHVAKRRPDHNPYTMDSADPRASYYSKASHEVAGGFEDWDEIDGRAVDRYGFIHANRPASRFSMASSIERPGMQRIATSLRIESNRDRKLARGPSSKRSSRSLPPKSSSEWTPKRGPESVHSTHSNTARRNPFRSRTRKAVAEASNMLTVPPGLADINEDEDAGKTASTLKQREWAREEKWQKMARPLRHKGDPKGGGMRFDFDTTDSKLIERTWKGIPDRWRATAWHSFLSASAKKRNSTTTDEELIGQFFKLQEMPSPDDVQIDVDVPRTVNMHVMFRRRYRGGQRLLFRVLHAVSLYFPDTGYVQGMASLAATLLCYFDEEKAFVMMVRLWQLRGLDELFQDGFAGLMTCLNEFETQWLGGGEVAAKLEELNITSTAYGTRWYLTLFNMSIPFPAQLRVWDVFMLLGDATSNETGSFGGADLDVLHATSAALIDATRDILLDSDFENAMKVLTSFVPVKDEDVLMRVAKAEYKMKKKRDGVKA
ncbi:TBC domain-containing protein [Fulvia fulva]|uniref:TBC domain-containing protein n=1 Tax=Passalora fulva TaxID=5499 RepID=A0A9Q8UTT7_PASFU|nr:TBC domain-containing protein [Fulvia fulva]KAK4613927.1 TBC domain-containing protein [Fulvia fulva]KAK4614730.1 TBC domain-containing protein [Fulvia fulva]UJO22165.1 TBC domain-containing protein [Fulvia fulva]WPV20623.1 TBC domain-containing protein [Fulvia fulva]WPV35756.1 TBC domain-containing protein [Fulvia fulva]